MSKESFSVATIKGENVWKKGTGLLVAPQFMKIEHLNGSVKLSAWIKYPILPGVYVGEMGISGLFGALPKGILKKRVIEIESRLK